jgi:hypothetical protein
MNHCVDCGRRTDTGRTLYNIGRNQVRCLLCQTARVMRGWTYRNDERTRLRQRIAELEAGQCIDA